MVLWLRSIPGNDGDVGQKEMGSAVLLLKHTGCLAAAPPALEPYHLPSVRRFSFPAWLSGQSLRAALMARLLWVLEAALSCGSVLREGLRKPLVGRGGGSRLRVEGIGVLT